MLQQPETYECNWKIGLPIGPGRPGSPLGPCTPRWPISPTGPAAPACPGRPEIPAGPDFPVAPILPGGPRISFRALSVEYSMLSPLKRFSSSSCSEVRSAVWDWELVKLFRNLHAKLIREECAGTSNRFFRRRVL